MNLYLLMARCSSTMSFAFLRKTLMYVISVTTSHTRCTKMAKTYLDWITKRKQVH